MRTLVAAISVLASQAVMHAQIVVDAGKDTLQLCQGQTAQLGGSPTALGGRAPYRYQWDPPVGLSDPSAPNPVVTAFRSQQRYVLTVTDADGAIGRDTVVVLMYAPPRITAGGTIEVCVGQDVVLGGAPTAYGGQVPYQFEWIGLPAMAQQTTSSNPTFRADRVQQLTIILRVTDGRGCDAYDTARVVITQPITLALPQHTVEICAGEPVHVGANPLATGGTLPYRITWSPLTAISSPDIPNPTVFPTTSTRYYCTVTDAKGCTRTDSILVRVKPAMNLRLRDTSVCFGKEIQLGDSSIVSGGVPPYQFEWMAFDAKGQPVSDTFDRTHVGQLIVPPASRIYRLVVRDAQGCTQRATMTVTVSDPPIAEFALPPQICQGKTIVFGTAYNRLFDYQWSIEGAGGVILGDPMSNVVRIRWDSSGLSRVSLAVRDRGKGCDYSASAFVRVHPLPRPVIAVDGRTHLCPGETTVLDAGAGYTEYIWSNGARSQRVTISDQQAGTYTVTVTDTNGCTNTSPPLVIMANTTPQPQITGPTKFCAGTTIELRATPGFARYQWNTGETTESIPVSQPGTFTVTVYDSIGCPGTSQHFRTEFNPVSMSGGGDSQFLDRETLLDYPEQVIYFVNTDDEPLTLNAIRITPYYPDLRITRLTIDGRPIASIVGAVLQVGQRLDVYLKYAPQIPDTAVVRVELDVVLPCPWTFVQPIMLSSYDKRITTIAKVIDTHGQVGELVRIPVTLQLVNPQDSIIDATIDYTLRLNGKLFDLRSVEPGEVLSVSTDRNGWYSIRVVRQNVTLHTTEPVLLGTFAGTALASMILHDSVYISSIVVRDVLKQPTVQVRNGLLTLGTYCFPREVVLTAGSMSMQLNPNPATDQVLLEMRKPIAGQYTVEIVGLSGAVILRQTMELSAADQVTIPLALNDVPSGVALIRISTPAGVYRIFLSVVR
jgi:hypothetical protein